ncbi:hypothetical protein [Streptomyces sp. NPDC012508]|uniref:hypothetical protein n=1 Tax=Streptomyces sp. NPDC012508 TaxID=3364837 RepID=UPI0036985432
MTRAPRHGKPYDTRRLRIRAVLIGLAGVSALVAGTVLFAWLPHAVAEERAFRAATECRGAATTDCLRAGWYTVESVQVHRGKSPGGWVVVSGPDEAAGEVEFSGVGDFLDQVRPGDRVAGTIWRGRIIVLSNERAAQRTNSHPAGDSQFAAGTGTALLLAGGLGVHLSQWSLRHQEAAAWRRKPAALGRSTWAVGLLSAWSFLLPVLLHGRSTDLGVYFALWTPAALTACAVLIHVGRRGRAPR